MMIHIQVFGRVQGVGFRAWAQKRAESLSLSGWVRNRADGSVEILLDGEQTDAFLTACRRGPFFARVDKITPVSIPSAPVFPIEYGCCQILATV